MNDLDRLIREYHDGTASKDWEAWARDITHDISRDLTPGLHESASRVLRECDVNGEDDQFTHDLRALAEFVLKAAA